VNELSLFDKDPGFLSAPATPLERRFAKFHKDNPNVYRLIELAQRLRRRGRAANRDRGARRGAPLRSDSPDHGRAVQDQ
jgi:hypothetical protein